MLRPLESAHRDAVIIPISINVASTGITFNYGQSLFSAAVRNGAGDYVLTFKKPFNRIQLPVATILDASNTGARARVSYDDRTNLTILTKDSSDAALEPTGVNILVGGFYNAEYDKYAGKLFGVKAPMLSPRILFGEFSSAAATTIGTGDFTASKTSTGTYAITYRRPFAQAPIVVGMGYDDALVATVGVKTSTANSCVIEIYDHDANALADGAFSLFVMGSQGVGECGFDSLRQVLSTQRNCRLLMGQIPVLSSSTFSIGGPTTGTDFSSAAAAGGDATVNITDTFARSCVFVAQPYSYIARRGGGTSSSSQIRIKTADLGGGGQDDQASFLVLGSDDATEYYSAS